jgi:predicted DNA-binding transcriptional regulator YafY
VDFDAKVAEYVRARKVHSSQKISTLPDGGTRLSMVVSDLTEVISWVLGFGKTARVVEPPELVESVRNELEQALVAYSRPPPSLPMPSSKVPPSE